MTTVRVAASKEYNVIIERGLLDRIGEEARKVVRPQKAVVVSGEIAFPLYGQRAVNSLKKAGFTVLTFIHRTGEAAKSLGVYGKLVNFLCDNRVSRTDCLFALGGGVTGDLTGFAAATYLRGMPYIQIPTTLLACADSSVGGKTAVNLNAGKNQSGCFYQPEAVFCDPDTLSTLSPGDYRCGCAETLKHGILEDPGFFRELNETHIRDMEEHVIARNVEIKSRYVNRDEFDLGLRRKLNLGHSFGHAVEACSGFTVRHGDAVAIGMAAVARAAAEFGYCGAGTRDAILAGLEKYGLPARTDCPVEELYRAATADKKIAGGKMDLIVPERIGQCAIVTIPVPDMRKWMEAGGISL